MGAGRPGVRRCSLGARAPALSLAQDLCSFLNTTRPPWEECAKGGSHPRGVVLTRERDPAPTTGPEEPESRPHPARLIPQAWGTLSLSPTWEPDPCVSCLLWPLCFPPGRRTFLQGEDRPDEQEEVWGQGWGPMLPRFSWRASKTTQVPLLKGWRLGVALTGTRPRQCSPHPCGLPTEEGRGRPRGPGSQAPDR